MESCSTIMMVTLLRFFKMTEEKLDRFDRYADLSGEIDFQLKDLSAISTVPGEAPKPLLATDLEIKGAGFSVQENESFDLPDAPVFNKTSEAYDDIGKIPFETKLDWKVPDDSSGLVSLGVFSFTNNIDAKSESLNPISVSKKSSVVTSYAQVTVKVTDPIVTETKHDVLFHVINPAEDVSKDATDSAANPSETIWIDTVNGAANFTTAAVQKYSGTPVVPPGDSQGNTPVPGGETPLRFDFVGAQPAGASSDTPLTNGIEVADGETVELELFGRLYSEAGTIFKDSPLTVEALTDDEMTARHHEAGVTDYFANETRGEKAYIFADFDPNFNLSIDQAAELAGYDSFNWVQNITSDTDDRAGSFYAKNDFALDYPLTDPPANQTISGEPKPKDDYPYYLDMEDFGGDNNGLFVDGPESNLNGNFNIRDKPTVKRNQVATIPTYSGLVEFETHLVGVSKEDHYLSESLYDFDWGSNFDPNLQNFEKRFGAILSPEDIQVRENWRDPLHHSEFYGNDIDETGRFLYESPVPVETKEPDEPKTSDELVSDNLAPEKIESETLDDDLLLSSNSFGSSDVLVGQTTSTVNSGDSLLYQDVVESQSNGSDTFETPTDSVAVLNDGHSVFNSDDASVLPTVSTQEL
jgi:hypothetical protein